MIAFGIENKTFVAYPGFNEYAKYFKGTQNNIFCSFPAIKIPLIIPEKVRFILFKSVPLLKRLFLKLKFRKKIYSHIWVKPGEYFDMDNNLSKQKLLFSKVVTLEGWLTRCNKSFIKNEDYIRQIFTPDKKYFTGIKRKEKNITLIGVHIRQRDSIDSEAYLVLDDSKYKELMLACLSIFKNCKFVIVSNLPINKSFYSDLPGIYTNGNLIQDLYTLSSCDYIIGVSSTFSLWASFYGKVPMCIISKKNETINRSSFKVYKNLF